MENADDKIIVIGSCNVDLISYSDHFPKPGETLCGNKFSVGCGGKGANQCVMAAKLGGNVSMITSIGNDNFGEMFLKKFKEENIDTSCVHIEKDVSTGVAQILVNKEGENCIVIVKGANDCLTMEHVKNASHVVEKAKVAMFQLEIDLDVTLNALKFCKEKNCITIFNPAPAVQNLSADFLKYTTVLCCNETEAEILTGLSVTSRETCRQAIKNLLSRGPNYVILTMGSKGAMFGETNKDILHVKPNKSIVPEKVVDTTGAGDCFVGTLGFLFAKRQDLSFTEKVQRAVDIASISVGKPGTQTSYPSFDELPDSLKK